MAWGCGYNFAIPDILSNPASCAYRPIYRWIVIWTVIIGLGLPVHAQDWSMPEHQLARKILEITGTGSASVTFENRSSLGRRNSDIIQNGLRTALENVGIRATQNSPETNSVLITLSENANSYVWVAQVRTSQGHNSVVMVSIPKPVEAARDRESVPMTLHKTFLWAQPDPMLDVLVLEEGTPPGRIAVLEPERVAVYRLQAGKATLEQSAAISHASAWPRDLRGRMLPGGDHLFDVYLPGLFCRSTSTAPLALACRASDEPWPLIVNKAVVSARAQFVARRDYFSGTITPAVGTLSSVNPFYSAAAIVRDASALWVFGGTDRQIHIVDGVSDRVSTVNWGSDIAGLQTSCGSGWQILGTSAGIDGADSIRAYEIPDRDPVPVSPAIDFDGAISTMWTESKGDTGLAIVRNQVTGNYEAFRLAMACGQ